ncbi:MAG: AraC-like DNA-binding protein [Oleiphilaceae bacterium]|jgi:AraC-like DNA-binding protein
MAAITPLSSITYWNHFVRYSVEQDLTVDSVIASVSPHEGQDFIPFDALKTLIQAISDRSDKPWVGLDVAQNIQISSHGNLGFAVSHCVNLKECLVLIIHYYQTRLQAMDIQSAIENDMCTVTVTETCDWAPISSILHEVLALTFLNVLKFIVGNEVKTCTFNFPYPEPQWGAKYSELMPCAVTFGHTVASIHIPLSLLEIPCLSSNARSVDFAKNQCDIELSRITNYESLSEKITYLIENNHRYNLTVEGVAKYLNMSKSTLTRKLKVEDSSFKLIMDKLKKQRASHLLVASELSVEAIAFELGYEDNSNFGRSFKRWFNCSPSSYRLTNAAIK